MEDFGLSDLKNNSVAYISGQRAIIDMDPAYQRQGAIWSQQKQQLLIDTLINGFDVPKIYFHEFVTRRVIEGQRIRYALVDGKQRLEAIWDFLDGRFPLSDDFTYFDDPTVEIGGLTYNDLADRYPDIAALFNSTSLDIVAIKTDDLELIEEMFSRLNEAVPLNAAEKRNAFGGPLPSTVRALVEQPFFADKLPFNNSRYRWYDLAAKFLYFEHKNGATDTKKFHLDSYFKEMKRQPEHEAVELVDGELARTLEVLNAMDTVFVDKDRLLASVGMVSIYYLLFRDMVSSNRALPSRSDLRNFEEYRRTTRNVSDDSLTDEQFDLYEFGRLAQSPNDGGALRFRLQVLEGYLSRLP